MSADLEQRVTELEIKASFTEDLLDQLDAVIVRQQAQIELLLREIARLQPTSAVDSPATARNPSDDLPPHY
ncbi:MAG: SlyX family protein [Burkholderiaceae bacterium]